MALKTDYVDAVFDGNRKYQMVANSDGTYSFVDVTEYEVAGSYFGAEDINETNEVVNGLDLGLDDGSVTRVGTATLGSNTQPIYLSQGYPTASSGSLGSATQPIYMTGGNLTACNTTVGSGTKPIYSNAGVLTAFSTTVGGSNQPVYLSSGTITACNTMLPLSGGTMTGVMYAYNNTNYTYYQVRNIAFSTSVPSSLTNGTICFVYSS